jgi:cell division initiation protein
MSITPIDIQQHRFKTRPLGYEKGGVDQFLELVAEELEQYHRQAQELKEELARNRASLNEMRQREEMLKETLITAQRMTDEAEILIAEAGLKAERIVGEAEDRRLQLINELQEIKRQKVLFQSSLRGLVESHLHLLDFESLADEWHGRQEKLLQAPAADNREKPLPASPAPWSEGGSD